MTDHNVIPFLPYHGHVAPRPVLVDKILKELDVLIIEPYGPVLRQQITHVIEQLWAEANISTPPKITFLESKIRMFRGVQVDNWVFRVGNDGFEFNMYVPASKSSDYVPMECYFCHKRITPAAGVPADECACQDCLSHVAIIQRIKKLEQENAEMRRTLDYLVTEFEQAEVLLDQMCMNQESGESDEQI